MSLQVWLPLNGDLHNQGLAKINLTNTVTFATSGKIGQSCLNSELGWFSVPEMIGKKQMSFAYWVKLNAGTTTDWLDPFSWTTSNGTSSYRSRQEFYYYNKNGNTDNEMTTGVWYYNSSNSGMVQRKVGQWYHYSFSIDYETGISQFFVDGQLWKTTTNVDKNYYISGSFLLRESSLNCSINDFRLYDHCLNVKEVEEISKGLVLHYKLDNNGMGNLNLVDNSNWAQGTYHWTNWGSPPTRETVEVNGKKWIHLITNTTRFQGYSQNLIKSFGVTDVRVKPKANTQYTLSFTAYAASAGQKACIGIHWNNGTTIVSQSWMEPTLTTTPTRYSAIVTSANSTIDNMNIMVGDGTTTAQELWITDVKVEVGNKLSNWSPYDDNSVIYDSSGYNNNGTIVGSLETTTTSLRYSCATKMTNGQYIRVNNRPNACMPKDAITVNLWQYATSWSNPISCTEGGGWNFENNNGIRFPVYISGVGYKVAQSSVTTASTLNAWHMLTGTMDKDNIKIYYDGEEVGTVANGSTNGIGYANNYIFIGAEAQGDNIAPANSGYAGNISDVRIYATALTSKQIKELYNTSMTIDNHGNAYVRELVE